MSSLKDTGKYVQGMKLYSHENLKESILEENKEFEILKKIILSELNPNSLQYANINLYLTNHKNFKKGIFGDWKE